METTHAREMPCSPGPTGAINGGRHQRVAGLAGRFGFAAVTLALAGVAMAATTYSVTDLGNFGSSGTHFSYGYGINEKGEVVGFSYIQSAIVPSHYRAFFWEPVGGTITNLGDLPGGLDFSLARDINAQSEVVGYSSAQIQLSNGPATINRAIHWSQGSGLTDLGALVGAQSISQAHGINDAGHVTGSHAPTGLATFIRGGFFWDPLQGTTLLPHLYSTSLPETEAFAIDPKGRVVGHSGGSVVPPAAFIWDQVNGISALAGNTAGSSRATDLNGGGVVTGDRIVPDGNGGFDLQAMIWNADDGMSALGILAGSSYSQGLGINAMDQVVGTSFSELPTICIVDGTPLPPSCYTDVVSDLAFVWNGSEGMLELADLIDGADPAYGNVRLTSAHDLSNYGEIVANGFPLGSAQQHAYLLRPVNHADCSPVEGEVALPDLDIFGTFYCKADQRIGNGAGLRLQDGSITVLRAPQIALEPGLDVTTGAALLVGK